METMINLNDLLKHEILDLYSAEEQIIEAMPGMIEKAKNPELKKALREHLRITEEQKKRLDKVKESFGEGDGEGNGENKGFFSRLFGGSGGEKCKGMEGLIKEGEKIMGADITDEALDAAIIASAQKIEHYEICGYGTARAFARELQLSEVERLLSQTLSEEYQADDLLTALAVGKLNLEAERADGMENGSTARSNRTGGSSSNGSSRSSGGGSSKSSSKGGSSKGGSKSSGGNGGSSKGGGSNSSKGGSKGGGSKSSSKGGSSKGGSKSSGGKGGSSKGGGSKGSSKGGSRGGSKGGSKSGKGGSKGARRK
jgi:ferritin-like metal-binding protein YciE